MCLDLSYFYFFLQIFFSFLFIIFLFHNNGALGIIVYSSLAAVVANIQVLKVVNFGTFEMAEGTIVFCSLFWASDLLTEFFGPRTAFKALWLSFGSVILVMIWMTLTLWMPVIPSIEGAAVQAAMETLFQPSLRLFAASLGAYAISQTLDILILHKLKTRLKGSYLGMRGLLSTLIATCVDHSVFSFLAFRLLPEIPVPWTLFLHAYLLNGIGLRLLLSLGSPLILWTAPLFLNIKRTYRA